jgi:predicted enzyme related to lactoylglutathione lyase
MSDEPKHGTFCWNEMVTRDVDKAKGFFNELLGWEFTSEDMGSGMYHVAKSGDKQVCGMMAMDESFGDLPPHWLAYITVDDCDAAARRVEELGGTIHHPPTDIPKVGRFTVIGDPTGAVVGLISFPKK